VAALHIGCFTSGKISFGICWIGWVREKIWRTWLAEKLLSCRDTNPETSVVQPVTSRYNDFLYTYSSSFNVDITLRIWSSYGQVYVSHTSRSVDIKLKESQQHVDKSAVVQQNMKLGHRTQLHHTSFLSTETRYKDFSLLRVVHTGAWAHPTPCTMNTSGFILIGKANVCMKLNTHSNVLIMVI
jgi:hypothetical protein